VGVNWTTFLVEIGNFVVLVWLLTRFLYAPVTRAITARQQAIAEQMKQAREIKAQSEILEKQYQDRLVEWEGEKAKLKTQLQDEMSDLRASRVKQLEAELTRRREQEEAAARARDADRARVLEKQAAERAGAFASALLARIASPEVEKRIIDIALADLASLGERDTTALVHALGNGSGAVVVATRYPLDATRRTSLTQALAHAIGRAPDIRFEERESLIAGVHIDVGTTVLEADLGEELRWFAEHERDGA